MEHPSTSHVNPLLSRVRIPGQTFPLPSGGMFYKNGELSPECANGEVHVYPMTAIDEVVMKSVDKVFSGQAIKEVFARCIPSVLKVGELSAKDVDYLLVALRKVSYGAEVEVTYQHDCEDAEERTYTISLDNFLQRTKPINPVSYQETFKFRLENGQVVHFKPASYDDIVRVYQTQHKDLQMGLQEVPQEEELERAIDSVSFLIEKVDDVTDTALIKEWLCSVPVMWLRDISLAAQNTTAWGITFEAELKCQDCGEKVVVPTPMNPISLFI